MPSARAAFWCSQRVLDQHAAARRAPSAARRRGAACARRAWAAAGRTSSCPRCDARRRSSAARPSASSTRMRVGARRVGQDELAARQARAARRGRARWSRSRASRPGRRCVCSRKCAARDAVVAHQPEQRRAVALPVVLAQRARPRRRRRRGARRCTSVIAALHRRRTPRAPRRAACCRGRTARPAARLAVERRSMTVGRGRDAAERRADVATSARTDHRAVGLLGQDLEQHRVRHAAVDDVHRVDAALRRVERRPRSSAACRRRSCRRRTARRSRARVRSVSSLPSLSSTPGVLVSIISFSAFSTSASLPATTSALML